LLFVHQFETLFRNKPSTKMDLHENRRNKFSRIIMASSKLEPFGPVSVSGIDIFQTRQLEAFTFLVRVLYQSDPLKYCPVRDFFGYITLVSGLQWTTGYVFIVFLRFLSFLAFLSFFVLRFCLDCFRKPFEYLLHTLGFVFWKVPPDKHPFPNEICVFFQAKSSSPYIFATKFFEEQPLNTRYHRQILAGFFIRRHVLFLSDLIVFFRA